MKQSIPMPTESAEQQALFHWAALNERRYPELRMLHHIPNGGKRNIATARRLKAEGVKAGVPDICLPVARCGCHGLYIELKRGKGFRVTELQMAWIQDLAREGYSVHVCVGWEAAARAIEGYLRGVDTDIAAF